MSRWISISLVIIFLLQGGCATKSDIMDKVSTMNHEFERKVADVHLLIGSQVEEKFDSLDARISSIEILKENIDATRHDLYLKVISPINIYSEPRTIGKNIIAKADKGAYLRKLSCNRDNRGCVRFKVEFLVDDYPYIGYVDNDRTSIEEKRYDPNTFTRLYKRGLVQYYWEKEFEVEITKRKYKKTIGVYIKSNKSDKYGVARFTGHLARTFRNYGIYLIPLNASYDNNLLEEYSFRQEFGAKDVDVILVIDIVFPSLKSAKNMIFKSQSMIDVRGYNSNFEIIYAQKIPMQSIEIN